MDHVMKNNNSQHDGSGASASSSASSQADGLSDQAKKLGRDIKNKASDLTDSVTRTAKTQAQGLSEAASGLASDAMDKVDGVMNEKKSAGAEYIVSLADAVHRAANEIESEIPQAGQYIHQAADRMEDVATAVRDRNVREIFSEVEQFARKQPVLFFGGTLLLGFAAMRFLKTSGGAAHAASNTPRSMPSSPSTAPTTY